MYIRSFILHLRLQTSAPSNQLWTAFLLPESPQLWYQAPPGAQQLTRPDFLNVPQFGHILIVETTSGVVSELAISVLPIRHRGNQRSGDSRRHTVDDIDPEEPVNMLFLLAFEYTQAAPQSLRLKDTAFMNISSMLVTLDTSQFDMSLLNDSAEQNMLFMKITLDTSHF